MEIELCQVERKVINLHQMEHGDIGVIVRTENVWDPISYVGRVVLCRIFSGKRVAFGLDRDSGHWTLGESAGFPGAKWYVELLDPKQLRIIICDERGR